MPVFFHSASRELQVAAMAASKAGEIIRAGYEELHEIESKGIGDLVSEVDRKADKAAADVLNSETKPRPILSEELSPKLSGESSDFWIVDPLDGTSAFLFKTGNHFSSVIVALRNGNETELGVVYFPMTDEWFYAQKGQGAFVSGRPLESDSSASLSNNWVELNQYSDVRFETDEFRRVRDNLRTEKGAALVTQNAPYSGVAMRIADPSTLVVAAVHDNNPSSVKQAAWDIAGPQCILEEAGGVCINFDGERVDPFKAEPFVVACNQDVANAVIALAK